MFSVIKKIIGGIVVVPLVVLLMFVSLYGVYYLTVIEVLTVDSAPQIFLGVFAFWWIFIFPIVVFEIYRTKIKR